MKTIFGGVRLVPNKGHSNSICGLLTVAGQKEAREEADATVPSEKEGSGT